jgi:hypothetical protein
MGRARRRHTPEQIIRKLREAEQQPRLEAALGSLSAVERSVG